MDIVVLAKYVPDIDHIPASAWNYETGTLIRSRLRMFFNAYDQVALNMALAVRASRPGTRIHVLSMGPPSAEDMLRQAIAYGAGHAWLLSDRKFAGADTIATARALSQAILALVRGRRIRAPYAVFCGMQSPDGDTAQVPAQVASLLGAPLYPYVTGLTAGDDEFELRCLNTAGSVTIRTQALPFVATATRLYPTLPFYVSLADMIRAESADIPVLSCADLGIDEKRVGLQGSRTWVTRVFAPQKKHAAGAVLSEQQDTFAADACALLQKLAEKKPFGQEAAAGPAAPAVAGGGGAYYRGPCVSLAELQDGRLTRSSLETASQAARFARELGERAVAIVVGPENPSAADALRQYGIDEAVFITGFPPAAVCVHDQARAAAAVIRQLAPQIVIAGATLTGRVLAPYIAAELGCGLTADCSLLEIRNATHKTASYDRVLHQTRPALGGNIMATILSLYEKTQGRHPPQMATVRPGVLEAVRAPADTCATRAVDGAAFGCRLPETYIPRPLQAGDDHADLAGFDVVVCVGAAVETGGDIAGRIEPFCRLLEARLKMPVGLGCTRAVVDRGLLPHSRQIGQTGAVIRPKLYIGIGVSGSVQHKIGMENADAIVSINASAQAPIAGFSDCMLLGDYKIILEKIMRAWG